MSKMNLKSKRWVDKERLNSKRKKMFLWLTQSKGSQVKFGPILVMQRQETCITSREFRKWKEFTVMIRQMGSSNTATTLWEEPAINIQLQTGGTVFIQTAKVLSHYLDRKLTTEVDTIDLMLCWQMNTKESMSFNALVSLIVTYAKQIRRTVSVINSLLTPFVFLV